MGNCQATTEAAAVVIQHPGGRIERLYWTTSANEVMRSNPGHFVAHVTMIQHPGGNSKKLESGGGGGTGGHFTRVKFLRPKDTLVLGQVYRLVTSQEVIKGLRARRQEKKTQMELININQMKQQRQLQEHLIDGQIDSDKIVQVSTQVTNRHNTTQSTARARHWQPSLQSISEFGS